MDVCKTVYYSGVKGIYDYFSHWIFNKLVEIHHKFYIVWYPYGFQWYSIKVPRVRGPPKFLSVKSDGNDITEEILRFMGPSHNFHGIPTSPNDLGYSEITFETVCGETKTFNNDEIITI